MKGKYISLILVLLIVSCSKEIDIVNYVDSSKPFRIVQLNESFEFGKTNEIQVSERKHKRILEWLEINNQNWEFTPASYIGELVINQEDFQLLFLKEMKSVVLSFIDEKGKSHQYTKSVNPEELKFLIE